MNLLYLRVTYCEKRNVRKNSNCPRQGRMKHLYGKNRPGQAGIPVAETGIPARRDETKNVPPPYKKHAIKTIETYSCRDPGHRPFPVNVPSRLSYKLAPSRVSYQQCMGHNNHDYNVRHKNGVYKYIPFSGTERHRNSFIPRAMRLEWLGT